MKLSLPTRICLTFFLLSIVSIPGIAAENKTPAKQAAKPAADAKAESGKDAEPCITGEATEEPCVEGDKLPRFVKDSPFDTPAGPSAAKRERRLWADSLLWAKSPELDVEKWITEEPDTKGKYVLIEVWATWCGPCRRSITLLNSLHKKYGDELIVIGICEEDEKALEKMKQEYPNVPKIEFYSAIDTKKRMKEELGVWGIPHAILLEPDGYVIWEGFPLQPGYELTETIIERVLAIGRKLRSADDEVGQ